MKCSGTSWFWANESIGVQELRKSPAPYNDPDEERRDVLSKAGADGFDVCREPPFLLTNKWEDARVWLWLFMSRSIIQFVDVFKVGSEIMEYFR